MKIEEPRVAWLEDNAGLRHEIRRQIRRELPDVVVYFTGCIRAFWKCLCDYSPEMLVLDVMLEEKFQSSVERISEGVYLAKWVRDGIIPEMDARELEVDTVILGDPSPYKQTPLFFVTGRSKDTLEQQLKNENVYYTDIFEKGTSNDTDATDLIVEKISELITSKEITSN